MKRVLITGANSMDGSHLVDYLLEKKYEVHCIVHSSINNLYHAIDKIKIYKGNLTDKKFLYDTIIESQPEKIFHLAALSYSEEYWKKIVDNYEINFMISLNILEAIKDIDKNIKILNISSSEAFGNQSGPLDENSILIPASPYGLAKMCSQKNIEIYRNKFDLFACNAICFNHESHLRPYKFVTRKLSSQIANIILNGQKKIKFGNIKIRKDWGYAPEFVDGMYKILSIDYPDDFVLATSNLTSLEDIIISAFNYVNIENWYDYIEIDEKFLSNKKIIENYGITNKANQILNWKAKTNIFEVMEKMINFDLNNGKSS